jgi:hypothetical protein
MTDVAVEHTDGIDIASTTRPYRPSWLDYLIDRVERLTVPAWFFYLAVWVVITGTITMVKWSDGSYAVGSFAPIYLVLPAICVYVIPFVQYIDKAAASALDSFRPALAVDDKAFRLLRYRLTTMPWRSTLLISLTAAVIGPLLVRSVTELDPGITFRISNTTYGALIDMALASLTGWSTTAVLYHTVRQLTLVSDILTHHTRIDLYETQSLYAFSNVTARTAIGLLIPIYTWVLVGLGGWRSWVGPTVTIIYTMFGILLFVWPLLGVHRLLEKEKHRLQIEAARRMKSASAGLHQRLDAQDLGGVTELKDAMEGLVMEKSDLDKISTWPWQAETARWLVTALLLPVILWIIQSLLSKLLTF